MFFQECICQLQKDVANSLQHSGEDWGWRLVCIAGLQLCFPVWGAVCAGTDESFWFSMFSLSSARLHWLSSSQSSTSGKEVGHLSNRLQQGCSSPCLAERQRVRSWSLPGLPMYCFSRCALRDVFLVNLWQGGGPSLPHLVAHTHLEPSWSPSQHVLSLGS